MIEEAAGLSTYKESGKEALHTMQATAQNTTRLRDLEEELVQQTEVLQQQADDAKAYQAHQKTYQHAHMLLTFDALDEAH